MSHVRSQVRLRVFLPLIAIAAAGLAFVQLGGLDLVGLAPDEPEPVAASASGSGSGEPLEPAPATTAPTEEPAPAETTPTEPVPADSEPAAFASESGGLDALEAELADHKVVVLVVYSPNASVDSQITREARLAAEEVGVGFLAVNGAKEKMIGELALAYDLRETPAVLVFKRGAEPELAMRLVGWADRETVSQAALDAKRAA